MIGICLTMVVGFVGSAIYNKDVPTNAYEVLVSVDSSVNKTEFESTYNVIRTEGAGYVILIDNN